MVGVRRLVVAVVFLAVLGAGVGYGLGALSRHYRAAAAAGPTTVDQSGGAATTAGPRCPDFIEAVAQTTPLYQELYLRTAQSQVWICRDDSGRLYYQGHSGRPGEDIVEGKNGLFLTMVEREGPGGYVATNADPGSSRITRYHVTATQLVKEFLNYTPPQGPTTEPAADN